MDRFPPPDPFESLGMAPAGDAPLSAPMAVFLEGRPSVETDRIADAILSARPGVLIVSLKQTGVN